MLSAGVVIPALATGNAVLLKPSEYTPESGALLESLFSEIDRFASWRHAWWFGYSPSHSDGIDAYVRVAHSHSVLEKMLALPAFVKFVFKPRRPV